MTIREYLEKQLVDSGMFEDQARQVMDRVVAEDAGQSGGPVMAQRWQDATDGYPPQLLAVLWIGVRDHALAWIDENCPRAWFRPMFVR